MNDGAALAALRTWLVSGETPRPTSGQEAREIVAMARDQGVAGLLHSALKVRGGVFHEAAADDLHGFHLGTLVMGVQQLEAARRVLALLEQQGLRALPMKGAALAESIYDSVGDRPMDDVDVLVLDDFHEAARALVVAGFSLRTKADHAWALADPVWGCTVELHLSPSSCPGFFPMDAEGLWTRSRVATGQIARLPATEDLLVQLGIHAAFQHGLQLRLVQYLDFRHLLDRASIDDGRLLDAARRAKAVAALAMSLRAAEVLVGASVPDAFRDSKALLSARQSAWLERRLESPLLLVSPGPSALASARYHLAEDRRVELVRGTLRPRGETAGLAGILAGGRRALSLAYRLAFG